ncbi:MAG: hypothetical protein JO028_01595 [Acidobacteriaceae bacterium]|nr:hypothetical protein [Acidobacteriaceae bacterium]
MAAQKQSSHENGITGCNTSGSLRNESARKILARFPVKDGLPCSAVSKASPFSSWDQQLFTPGTFLQPRKKDLTFAGWWTTDATAMKLEAYPASVAAISCAWERAQ